MVSNEYSNLTLTNCSFTENWTAGSGGGIENYRSNLTLTSSTFDGNWAQYSGAGLINYYTSTAVLTDVVFSNNWADWNGGGVLNGSYSTLILNRGTFRSNRAGNDGGGLFNSYDASVVNTVFSSNWAVQRGGGISNGSGRLTLTNVTLGGNSAQYGGGINNSSFGILNVQGMLSLMLNNAIVWGNSAPNGPEIYNSGTAPEIAYSNIRGCGGSGNWNSACGINLGGNIDADPRFLDSLGGDLRLRSDSPCVDAGDNTAIAGISVDRDGNPRFVDVPDVPDTGRGTPPIVDMGAYEVQGTTPPSGWQTIIYTDFEGDFPGPWTVLDGDGSTNGEYYWGKRNCRAYSETYSGWAVGAGADGAALSCGVNYPDNAGSWMVYGPFSLENSSAAELRFKLWLDVETNYDYICELASTDGTNFYGQCTTGESGVWIDRLLDLSNVPGLGNLLGQSQVWVALYFYSDYSVNYPEGVYVDEIVLRRCPVGSTCPVGSISSIRQVDTLKEFPFAVSR